MEVGRLWLIFLTQTTGMVEMMETVAHIFDSNNRYGRNDVIHCSVAYLLYIHNFVAVQT